MIKLSTLFKFIGVLIFGCAGILSAQSTVATATVVDPSSQIWANGSITYMFQGNGSFGGTYQWQGANLPAIYITPQTIKLNSSAVGTFTVPDSSAISPAGSKWSITVCPNASAPCITMASPITGTTEDISSLINSNITTPQITIGNMPLVYNFNEVQTSFNQGGIVYNTILNGPYYFNGTAWLPFSGGAITLTTAGTSGSATLIGNILNIPVYTAASGGYLLTAPPGSQTVTTPSNSTLGLLNTYASDVMSDTNEAYTLNVSNINNIANASTRAWIAHSTTMNCVGQGENLTSFWTTCNPESTYFLSNTRGIMDGKGMHMTHNGQGDTFGEYDYYTFFGGNVQGDDEGVGALKMQMHQVAWLSAQVSNGFAGSVQNYTPTNSGNTYINGRDIIPYTGSLGSITINFNPSYTAPTAGIAHIYLNTRVPGTNTFTATTDITVTLAATAAPQTFVSGTGFTPVTAIQGQYVSVYIPSGTGASGTSDGPAWGITGSPTVGTPAVFSTSYGNASISTTMAAPGVGATSLIATNIVPNGYNDASAGTGFADGGILINKTQVIGTATLASQGTVPALGDSLYYILASGTVTPSTAYGNIVSCTPPNALGLTNQSTQSTSCLVNVTSSSGFTTSSHIFLNGGYGGFPEEAAVISVTALSGGQQTVVFYARGGDYSVMMQGGPGGESMVVTSTINSQPIAYWIVGALSSTQLIVANCVQGSCNSQTNLPSGSPATAGMVLAYGMSMVRDGGGTVTLTGSTSAVSVFGVGSTIIVSGATPTDLNGTFTVATNTNDTIGNIAITWAQTGAAESTTTNATFSAPNTSITFYPSAWITGTLSGAIGGLQLGVNNVNWTLNDSIVGSPTNSFSATGLYIVQGQNTSVNGSNPSHGIVIQDDGPSSMLAAISASNSAPAYSFITAQGQYSQYFNFPNRPVGNGCVICIFGTEPISSNQKPYYLFEDHNTGFGGILIDPLNYKYVFSQAMFITPGGGGQVCTTTNALSGCGTQTTSFASVLGTYSLGTTYHNTSGSVLTENIVYAQNSSYGADTQLACYISTTTTMPAYPVTESGIRNSGGTQSTSIRIPINYYWTCAGDSLYLVNYHAPVVVAWYQYTN
jgi:hypothetical protein